MHAAFFCQGDAHHHNVTCTCKHPNICGGRTRSSSSESFGFAAALLSLKLWRTYAFSCWPLKQASSAGGAACGSAFLNACSLYSGEADSSSQEETDAL
jgi:hypothetical protein